MNWEIISALICAVNTLLLIGVLLLLRKNAGKGVADGEDTNTRLAVISSQLEQQQRGLADESERNRRETREYQQQLRRETGEALSAVATKFDEMKKENFDYRQKLLESLNASLNTMHVNNAEQNERQSRMLSQSITRMQESNEQKLDLMRATVDEKLTATLTTRLDSSFKTVSQQLENVYKSLGEMRELSSGVTDNVSSLNRILTNVKARGTWAEVQLGNILDQTIPGMYVTNYSSKPDSRERVEFAIRIPSPAQDENDTYLPVDSKFPVEDYIRFCEAADAGDAQMLQSTRKSLENSVLTAAKAITKYIDVPATTPFAIMYLATEGLYAEIASSRSGLPEKLQTEFNIMIAGPTTITALLNSLSMGFRAVAINEKANEVRRLLAAAKQQYAKFGDVLQKARKKIDEAGKTLDEAQDRNRIINNKLKSIESLDSAVAADTLGIIEADDEE